MVRANGKDITTYFNKYKVKKYVFEFDPLPPLTIESIEDMDKILDDITDDEFNTDERLPYWAEIWPSAIGLSRFLNFNINLENQHVLELGSGLGLAGLICGLKGANVTFSDYEPIALEFCKHNAKLNHLKNCEYEHIDWRNITHSKQYDLVIAADVIYESRFLEPMLNSIISFLRPGGRAILAEPGRNVALPFFNLLRDKGLNIKQFQENVSFKNRNQIIDIYAIS